MSRRRVDPIPQRQLALLLRYHIDSASMRNESDHVTAVRSLVDQNPRSSFSKHVIHNLGKHRIRWMIERGILPSSAA